MLLTTGPLDGDFLAALPASQCEEAPLDGGSAQKNRWEYSSFTVWPWNQARVNPILIHPDPPLVHGSGSRLALRDPDAMAEPNARPNASDAMARRARPVRMG